MPNAYEKMEVRPYQCEGSRRCWKPTFPTSGVTTGGGKRALQDKASLKHFLGLHTLRVTEKWLIRGKKFAVAVDVNRMKYESGAYLAETGHTNATKAGAYRGRVT